MKRSRKAGYKTVGIALSAILTLTSLVTAESPRAAAAADRAESGRLQLTASYDMSHEGERLIDISGSGHDAEIVGFTEEDFSQDPNDIRDRLRIMWKSVTQCRRT